MRNDLTEVVLIVDESGSMYQMRSDTIGHINKFIEEQKMVPGECNFTLVFFDDRYRVIRNAVDIQRVKNINEEYMPTGMTALLDAIGKTINSVGTRLREMSEKDRPGKVIFAILTDGAENASKEFNQPKIKEMIQHQEGKYNWKFLFLAENIDAKVVGLNYGILNTLQNKGGVDGYNSSYTSISNCVSHFRSTGEVDLKETK